MGKMKTSSNFTRRFFLYRFLTIGRDADGVVVGVKDVLKAEESLANSIADRICPALLPELEIATVEGKDCSEIAHIHF